ncbi:MAG: hypothetical protein IJS35_02410 [Firmicutes bacterium]|nr:hypothetical protein [Bacillota bacterium]
MKKAKILISAIAVLMSLTLLLSGCGVSEFVVDNADDGTVGIIALKAGAGSGGLGYVTVEDGEKLHVDAALTKKSGIKMSVVSAEYLSDADYVNGVKDAEIIMEDTFSGEIENEYDIPAGDYVLRIETISKTSGAMTIYSE